MEHLARNLFETNTATRNDEKAVMRLSAIIFIRLNISIFKWLCLKNGTCLHGKTLQFLFITIIIFTDDFLHSSSLGITRRQDRALCNKACVI